VTRSGTASGDGDYRCAFEMDSPLARAISGISMRTECARRPQVLFGFEMECIVLISTSVYDGLASQA
jgi:hypothetical protein